MERRKRGLGRAVFQGLFQRVWNMAKRLGTEGCGRNRAVFRVLSP